MTDELRPAGLAGPVAVGSMAPGFALEGTDGTEAGHRTYTLAEHAGRPLVLVFYPADNTPVCTVQLTTYTADVSLFSEVGATVLAISPQSVESHDEFAASQGGFGFPLLADEDRAVGASYGVLGPLGFYRRSVFVVDPTGRVCYSHRSTAGLTFRPVSELVDAVRSCPG